MLPPPVLKDAAGDRSRSPTARSWAAVVGLWSVLTLGAPSVTAQDPATDAAPAAPAVVPPEASDPNGAPTESDASPPARFLIESIVVEGARQRAQPIVAAETLLAPGNSYSEAELQQALQRVERLPFVIHAEFALRRGSERGRFVLAIIVTEARPVFYGGAMHFIRDARFPGRWTGELEGPGLGARVFLGGQSEISAGLVGGGYSRLEGSFALFNVAYTHHNLFGRHIAGTFFLTHTGFGFGEGLQLALPLDRVSAVRLAAERLHTGHTASGYAFDGPSTSDDLDERVSLQWQRDTTDDPFTPRRGTQLNAAVVYQTRASSQRTADGASGGWEHQQAELVESVGASSFWPLSQRLSFGITGRLGRFRLVGASWSDLDGSLETSLSGILREPAGGRTQFSWRLTGTVSDWSSPYGCGGYVACRDSTSWMLSASVAGRGRWGSVVLGYHYRQYFHGWPRR